MALLEAHWRRMRQSGQLQLLCDVPFRQDLAEECFDDLALPAREQKKFSAADRVVRKMLADRNISINFFITGNPRDFEDVCKRFRRLILPL